MDLQQARQLAQDETTAPDKLTELARHKDLLTRQYVASNPNTPAEILLSICWEFPNEVINNPIIPLLLFENPHLLTCEIKGQISVEIKRLGWTKDIGREYLFKNYGKRPLSYLTDEEILDFLSKLRQIK